MQTMTADGCDVKINIAANEAQFWEFCRNMGHFLSGAEKVKYYVNVHLHCIVSSLIWTRKMSTSTVAGKNFCGRPCLCCLCL